MTGIAIGKDAFANADGGIAIGADITADAGETRIRGVALEVAGKHPDVTGPLSSHLRLRDENGDLHELSVTTGGEIYPALTELAVDVQVYTAGDHTWTKPAGAKLVYVVIVGAGSGGSGGTSAAWSSSDPDAYHKLPVAGLGGNRGVWLLPADQFAASVPVHVAAGTPGTSGGTASGPGEAGYFHPDYPQLPEPSTFGQLSSADAQFRGSSGADIRAILPPALASLNAGENTAYFTTPRAPVYNDAGVPVWNTHATAAAGSGGGVPTESFYSWADGYPQAQLPEWSGEMGVSSRPTVSGQPWTNDATVLGGTGSGGNAGENVWPGDVTLQGTDGENGGYPGGGGGVGGSAFVNDPASPKPSGSGGNGADGQIIVITI